MWKLHSRSISACGFLIARGLLALHRHLNGHAFADKPQQLSLLQCFEPTNCCVTWNPESRNFELGNGRMNFGDSLSCFIIQKTSTRHSSCMNTCLLPEELEGFLVIFFLSLFSFFFFYLFMFVSAIVDREPQMSVVASCITHGSFTHVHSLKLPHLLPPIRQVRCSISHIQDSTYAELFCSCTCEVRRCCRKCVLLHLCFLLHTLPASAGVATVTGNPNLRSLWSCTECCGPLKR